MRAKEYKSYSEFEYLVHRRRYGEPKLKNPCADLTDAYRGSCMRHTLKHWSFIPVAFRVNSFIRNENTVFKEYKIEIRLKYNLASIMIYKPSKLKG